MSTPETLQGRLRRNLRQFMQFGFVGGAGVGVNMVVTFLMNVANGGSINSQRILLSFPGTPYNLRFTVVVWIVAFLVANLFNFVLNRYWTFGEGAKAPFWAEFWPFLAVGSVAAFVGIFLKVAFTNPTSPMFLPAPWFSDSGVWAREYWSQLFTIVITMPINFVVNKLWTFRAVRRRHTDVSGGRG